MPIQFEVSQGTLREIAQSVLEAKKMARSLENISDTFKPLANDDAMKLLEELRVHAVAATDCCNQIYNAIAREAMKA